MKRRILLAGMTTAAICLIGIVVIAVLPVHHDWVSAVFGIAGCVLALVSGRIQLRITRR